MNKRTKTGLTLLSLQRRFIKFSIFFLISFVYIKFILTFEASKQPKITDKTTQYNTNLFKTQNITLYNTMLLRCLGLTIKTYTYLN
jgi:hypothetical protein